MLETKHDSQNKNFSDLKLIILVPFVLYQRLLLEILYVGTSLATPQKLQK